MRIFLQKWICAAGILLLVSGKLNAQHFSFTCARDTVIPACLPSGCFTLKHIIPDLKGLTDSYTINPSNYGQSACVPQYVAPNDPAGTPTNLTIDDTYSGAINPGFPFPFYGITYNSLVASANGYISFDVSRANGISHWAAGADLPSATYDPAVIMGPYHDLDPSVNTSPTQRIQYQVWGVSPHRRWVLSFYRVPLFGGACNALIENTHQIILYESTGIIEIMIQSKQACNLWNSGRALVGIQNFARTLGMTVPGRAAIANPPWSVSAPGESWRFVPNSGASLFKRVELLDAGGTLLTTGTASPIPNGRLDASFPNVCPPAGTTTTYIVRSVYQKIDDPATEIFGYDTVRVNRSSGLSANASFSSGSCGAATGTISVNNVLGGDGNYQYSLNGGPYQAGNVFSGLTAGNYTVTIRDGSATPCTVTLNVTVPQTGFLTATITAVATTCATFSNGSITVNSPNGGGGYTITVDNGVGTFNNVSVPYTINNLAVGSYQVNVSHPATSCNLQAPVTINVTQGPGVTGDITAYTPASCFFANNGSATIRPTAGTGPFIMTLSPGGTVVTNVTNPHTFTNLPGGPGYSVVIQDATGCNSAPIQLTIPSGSVSATATPSSGCGPSSGVITITNPGGGNAPYEYALGIGGPWQTSTTFTGLTPGNNYTVYVRDASQVCITSYPLTIPAATGSISINTSSTNASCAVATNGTITVTVPAGGVYGFSIDGQPPFYQASPYTFTNVGSGGHNIVVTAPPPSACTSGPVFVSVGVAASFSATTVVTSTTCPGVNDGIITVTPDPGGSPYLYVLDGTNSATSGGASYPFMGLAAGNHTLVVTNVYGCVTATINVNVPAGPPLSISPSASATSCSSATDGSITIPLPAGGSGNYIVRLDGGGPISTTLPYTFNNVASGAHTVIVVNAAGCNSGPVNVNVAAGPALTASIVPAGTTCGTSNGSISINSTGGGTAPYQYSIDGVTWQSGSTFTNLPAGTYTVQVRDNAAVCLLSTPNIVVASSTAITSTTQVIHASCGSSNGSITVNPPTGGTSPYQYSIDGGTTWQASPVFPGLGAGTYAISIRDAAATVCTSTLSNIIVNQIGGIVTAGTSTNIATCGASNGSITVTIPSGGTPPYQYSINGGTSWQAGNIFPGLAPGTYTVTIRDAGSPVCTISINNVLVAQTTAVSAAGATTTQASCGGSNGSITVNVPTGGTAPYQYSIDGGTTWQASPVFPGLIAGNYTVTIRDAGATACTASISNINVSQTSAITAAGATTSIATCGSNNGSVTVNAPSGGTPPYQYSINGGATWQAGATFTGLAPGSYTVTIRDAGATACTTTITGISVGQTTAITAAGASTTTATCGSNNGSLSVNAPGGGTPPYQYSINGGTSWQPSPTFTGLAPGSYTVTIRDASATPCTGTINNISVSGTTAITAAGTSSTQATCGNPNGSITVNTPTGGTAPYQYSINGGTSWQASPTFTGLTAGSYMITIRDAGATACTTTIPNVTVGQTSAVSASPSATGATCGNANGSINVAGATGGTPPYQYSLDGITWQASPVFSGLPGNNYTVWVRDNAATCNTTIPVVVPQTTAVAATTTSLIATCGSNNGSITVNTPTGGTPPYQYSIDGGTTWQVSATFNGLAAGSYAITIRDAGATVCSTTLSNINVGGTTAITAAGTGTTQATCGINNGSITVNPPSGGTPPYQYSIDGGTTWQASNLFGGLAGGNYTITIRDAGATVCNTTISNVIVSQTSAVMAAGSTTAVASCGNSNGSITVNAPSGGTPPYQYSIDAGSTWQVSNVFGGLAGGTYNVTIRDAGATACTATISNVSLGQTTAVAAAGAVTGIATCGNNNGSITVNAPSGGTAPYQYSIDGGTSWQASPIFNGLAPGNYTITIRDAGATVCTASVNNINVGQTTAVAAAGASTTQATCGNPNGSITVNAPSGGTAPYQYSIDGGTSWQASPVFNGLPPGNYSISIRDAGATVCTATIPNINVGQTSAVSAAPVATGATCGNANGSINVAGATGGTPPYQYSLDGITWQAGNSFTGLTGNNYTVWVRDLGGTCSTTLPVIVTQTAAVTATTSTTPTACGVTTGTLMVNGTAGGTAPYQYSLDGVTWQASNTFNNLGVGNYTVRVRDNAAVCSTTLPATITQTGSIAATTTTAQASCSGVNNGSVTITSAGGSGPYTFSLDGGAPQSGTLPYTFNNVGAGPHTVVVADQGSGCSTNVLNVTVGAGAGVSGSAAQTATSCPTAANGSVTVTASAGVAPYTFSLDGGAAQAGASPYTFNNITAGAHSVLITDANGCTSTMNITVAAGPALAASGTTTVTACTGVSTGTISITAANGTSPFQYSLDGAAPVAGASPYTFTNVAAGPHTIIVTDAAGCVSNLVNLTVATGAGVSGTTAQTATSCPAATNGTISVTATTGIAPYTFSLDGGAFQSGASPFTFMNVAAGPHTIVIRDNAGCTQTINATVAAGPALSTSVTKADALCNGGATGSITVTPPASGVPPFQYSLDGVTWQAGNVFPGLIAGTYTVYYRESGGCQGSQPVTIAEPAAIAANGSVTAARCNGQSNGTITVTAAGGTGPYQYSIDGGATWQASSLFTVAAGSYTITIRDANNCNTTRNFTVTEPAVLTAGTVTTQASCNGGNDGVITVTAAGGNAGYQYSADGINFQASNVFNVGPGAFNITVRDNQGCVASTNATVTVGSNFVLVPQPDITICEGRSAQLQVSSNATQFSWSPATGLNSSTIANPVASPVTTTQYIVTATFGRCSGSDTILVRVNPAPIPNAGPDGIVCYGQPYQLQGSGGIQYQWTPSNYLNSATIANPVASPPRQTTYSLSILGDANGCASLVSDQVTLDVNPPITIKTTPFDTIAYTGDQFPLLAVASDPTATNYSWSPAGGLSSTTTPNPDVTITAPTGTILRYQVSATNAAGCRGDGFVTIRVYKGPDVYVPSGFTPNGDGRNDRLVPIPVGIERLSYFRVVNRWGQLVYSTSKLNEGWDGKLNGTEQPSAVYVWMFEGFTRDGKRLRKEGTVALIR